VASTTVPRRTSTTIGSIVAETNGLPNGRDFRYGREIPTILPQPAVLDYEAEETLVVSDREQLRALADELRARIIALLRERAWSTQELSRELDVPKGTVGHHLKVLERAGLIQIVRTRQVRAVTEKYYGRVAKLFLFEAEDPADARALGAATMRQAAHELERAPEGATWGLVRASLLPRDARRFERRLDKLIEDFRVAEVPEGAPHRLLVGLWPTEDRVA
jgi:DNA-binding transcriptional ArsR family regulator